MPFPRKRGEGVRVARRPPHPNTPWTNHFRLRRLAAVEAFAVEPEAAADRRLRRGNSRASARPAGATTARRCARDPRSPRPRAARAASGSAAAGRRAPRPALDRLRPLEQAQRPRRGSTRAVASRFADERAGRASQRRRRRGDSLLGQVRGDEFEPRHRRVPSRALRRSTRSASACAPADSSSRSHRPAPARAPRRRGRTGASGRRRSPCRSPPPRRRPAARRTAAPSPGLGERPPGADARCAARRRRRETASAPAAARPCRGARAARRDRRRAAPARRRPPRWSRSGWRSAARAMRSGAAKRGEIAPRSPASASSRAITSAPKRAAIGARGRMARSPSGAGRRAPCRRRSRRRARARRPACRGRAGRNPCRRGRRARAAMREARQRPGGAAAIGEAGATVSPERDSRASTSAASPSSPPNRWATPETSSISPSGPSSATSGVKRAQASATRVEQPRLGLRLGVADDQRRAGAPARRRASDRRRGRAARR